LETGVAGAAVVIAVCEVLVIKRPAALTVLAVCGFAFPASAAQRCRVLSGFFPINQGVLAHADAMTLASVAYDQLNRANIRGLSAHDLAGRLSALDFAAGDSDDDRSIDKGEYLAVVDARFVAAGRGSVALLTCRQLETSEGRALLALLR
jgi:hypothetical protein